MASSATTKAVIATVAEDRPGFVSELSELVLGLELNIEDSRMSVLGGEFAVLMSVAGSEAAVAGLEDKLAAEAERGGFVYLFRRTTDRDTAPGSQLMVVVDAMDQPGIVHRVTSFFSQRDVNIRELTTETERAAHTGAPVFNLKMQIELPEGEPVSGLQEGFRAFCEGEGLDGELITP
jgi:glycine cleavage system transcriptional repressor